MDHISMRQILRGLGELSDKAEQERLWLSDGSEGKDVSSIDEAACAVFDDSCLDEHIGNGTSNLEVDTIELIEELGKELDRIDRNHPIFELIHSTQMNAIRNIASECLKKLGAETPLKTRIV